MHRCKSLVVFFPISVCPQGVNIDLTIHPSTNRWFLKFIFQNRDSRVGVYNARIFAQLSTQQPPELV